MLIGIGNSSQAEDTRTAKVPRRQKQTSQGSRGRKKTQASDQSVEAEDEPLQRPLQQRRGRGRPRKAAAPLQ